MKPGVAPHVHSREEEGFYLLEGEITLLVADERIVATAGTFVNLPVGTPHLFKNESRHTAKLLISVVPAGPERMFLAFGVPVPQGAAAAPPPAKEEVERL
jgi:quercetin dioxygenase-like cupin family protein